MLPKIVKAVDGRAKIIVDGGFLRGADICKGICAGADLVAMGRFVALGMAAGGEESLVRAFDLLLEEMHTVMVRCLPCLHPLAQLHTSTTTTFNDDETCCARA